MSTMVRVRIRSNLCAKIRGRTRFGENSSVLRANYLRANGLGLFRLGVLGAPYPVRPVPPAELCIVELASR